MIHLSESAAKRIVTMQAEPAHAGRILRILVEPGGCSGFEYGMSFDTAKEDDVRMESQGVAFVVDPASLTYIDECRVEFDDGLNGKGFEIKNPNASSTCGCGRSFN